MSVASSLCDSESKLEYKIQNPEFNGVLFDVRSVLLNYSTLVVATAK